MRDDRIYHEVEEPAEWMSRVKKGGEYQPYFSYRVNKEEFYKGYKNKYKVYYTFGKGGVPNKEMFAEGKEPKCDHIGEFSHEEIVMPNGRIITPIRQFCETKILSKNTEKVYFYNSGAVSLTSVQEAEESVAQPPTIKSHQVSPEVKGTKITLGYSQVEESVVDMVVSTNRSFSLESISDETKVVLNAFNDDKNSSKMGRWLNGNGEQITDDYENIGNLTIQGLLFAKDIIAKSGLDSSNLVLYTTGKAIDDLINDPDIDKYIGILGILNNGVITQSVIESVTGIKIIKTSQCPVTNDVLVDKPETIWQKIKRIILRRNRGLIRVGGDGRRSVLFIPNLTFGLAVGDEVVMEVQVRPELQAFHLTGTQKSASIVKEVESAVRISHR